MSKKWYEDYSDVEYNKQKEQKKKIKRQSRKVKRQFNYTEDNV